jgi:hypothetical protein
MWESAMKVGAIARSTPYFNGSKITLAINKPRAAVQMFTMGNIVPGTFKQTFLPRQERATEIEIAYKNRDNDYQGETLTIYDPTLTKKIPPAQLNLMGCTKRSEGWRHGNFRLGCNRVLKRVIEWGADIDAIASTVGDVVYLQHDVPQWGEGSRLVSATVNTVTLDKQVTLSAGKTYSVMIRLSATDALVTKAVTDSPGDYTVLHLGSNFDIIPAKFDLFWVGEANPGPKPVQILDIKRTQDQSVNLYATEYNERVYDADLGISPSETPSYSGAVPYVTLDNLTLTEQFPRDAVEGVRRTIEVSFTIDSGLFKTAEIWYKKDNGEWTFAGITAGKSYILHNIDSNVLYTVKVVAINNFGAKTPWDKAPSGDIYATDLPATAAPTGLLVSQAGETLRVSWQPPDYAYVDHYEVWKAEGAGNFGKTNDVQGTEIVIPISDPKVDSYTIGVCTVSLAGEKSPFVEKKIMNSAIGSGEVSLSEIRYTVEGNAITLQWDVMNDPQIALYEVRNGPVGSTWETAVKAGESTTGTFIGVMDTTKPIWLIKAKLSTGAYLSGIFILRLAILAAPGRIDISVAEPNIVADWPDVPGADKYRVIVDAGGLADQFWVTESRIQFLIPKHDTLVRVQAWNNSGIFSDWVDEDVTIAGIYSWNEVIQLNINITGGKYLNMCYTAGNEVRKPSVAGSTVALPISDINDCDLFNFADAYDAVLASDIQDTPASWFRGDWWRPKDGFFESGIYDLGAIYTGRLIVRVDKTVSYLGSSIPLWESVLAKYLEDFTALELEDQKTHVEADLYISTDNITWATAKNNDWITAQYIKFVGAVTYASPLSEVKIGTGQITIDVPDLTESKKEVGVTGGSKAITFTKGFRQVKSVLCNGVGAGITAWATNVTAAGFTLNLSTSSATDVYFFAKGY